MKTRRWACWVFTGEAKCDSRGPDNDVDCCTEAPVDMGSAAVVNETGEMAFWIFGSGC